MGGGAGATPVPLGGGAGAHPVATGGGAGATPRPMGGGSGATPVPLSPTVVTPGLEALLIKNSDASLTPAAIGTKPTVTWHEEPAEICRPEQLLLLIGNTCGDPAAKNMAWIWSGASPVSVSVKVCEV